MTTDDGTTRDDASYTVVRNDEEQYSIWRSDAEPPAGWHLSGVSGSKAECLAYIETAWTDLRPLSVRRARSVP